MFAATAGPPRDAPHKRGEFQLPFGRHARSTPHLVSISKTEQQGMIGLGSWFKPGKVCDTVAVSTTELADLRGQVTAIGRSQAVIEFALNGTILNANDNFLNAVGYTLAEIRGQHHRMFVDAAERDSPDYRRFWQELGSGQYHSGQYKRIGKAGNEIWLQASYNPILDAAGRPMKVVKYCTAITDQKMRAADFEGQIAAISKAQAVIEFNLDGTIRSANANFLRTVGYSLEEIRGQHHRMFVDPAEATTEEYRQFWAK